MFEPVAGLFTQKRAEKGEIVLSDGEARHWVERWLRERCGSEGVYCEQVGGGSVRVRVNTGWLRQEVVLWQEDLLTALRRDLSMECNRLQFVY